MPSLTFSPRLPCLIAWAAEFASGAEIVTRPSIEPSLSSAALIACETAVGSPNFEDGSGSWELLPPLA